MQLNKWRPNFHRIRFGFGAGCVSKRFYKLRQELNVAAAYFSGVGQYTHTDLEGEYYSCARKNMLQVCCVKRMERRVECGLNHIVPHEHTDGLKESDLACLIYYNCNM